MYDSDEEYYDPLCFEGAMEALSKVETLKEIQEAARRLANSEISICYTKSDRLKHHIHFLVKDGTDIEGRCAVKRELSRILAYDEVMVVTQRMSWYESVTPVSKDNLQGMLDFLKRYRAFLNEIMMEKAQASNAQALAVQGLMPAPAAREPAEKRHKSESSSGELDEKRENSSSPETISPNKKKSGFSPKQ